MTTAIYSHSPNGTQFWFFRLHRPWSVSNANKAKCILDIATLQNVLLIVWSACGLSNRITWLLHTGTKQYFLTVYYLCCVENPWGHWWQTPIHWVHCRPYLRMIAELFMDIAELFCQRRFKWMSLSRTVFTLFFFKSTAINEFSSSLQPWICINTPLLFSFSLCTLWCYDILCNFWYVYNLLAYSRSRRIGSITDYDPINEQYGSIVGQYTGI